MELKPGYKQTEVGIIPSDWDVRIIRDVCTLINGRGFKPHEWESTGLPIIRIQNLNGSDDFNYYSGIYNPKIIVENKQLLFAWSGSRGTSFGPHIWGGGKALLNYHTWKVDIDVTKIDAFFFFYALRHLTSFIEDAAHGASALVHTQKGEMEQIPLAIPPLPEQRAIAAALSDTDALLSSLNFLLAKKRDIKQAVMQQLLSGKKRLQGFSGKWEVKRLEQVAIINMGQSPDSQNYNRIGKGIPLIQGNADIVSRETMQRVWTTQITKQCDKGDLILTVRAPVGAIAIASQFSCLGRGVCSLRAVGTDQRFLFYALVFSESAWKVLEQGSTFTSANSAQVASFRIPIAPKVEEQTAIADVLFDMDADINALTQRRDKTRALKQGMMQELLTGRTRLV